MMRVLVVEDNALLRHHLKVQLQDSGHQVDAAEDAREADYYLNEHLPDIAIVDLGLPDEDGLSLIRRWRSSDVSLPVLVLTAREGWQDKVEVLSSGADDYVTKPFHIEEVMARMQALMRRNSGLASQVINIPPFQWISHAGNYPSMKRSSNSRRSNTPLWKRLSVTTVKWSAKIR